MISRREKKYVIFDTDMGTDDAWALLLLLKAEKYFKNIKLLGITCTHGNAGIDDVLRNAHRVLDVYDRKDVSKQNKYFQANSRPSLFFHNSADSGNDLYFNFLKRFPSIKEQQRP